MSHRQSRDTPSPAFSGWVGMFSPPVPSGPYAGCPTLPALFAGGWGCFLPILLASFCELFAPVADTLARQPNLESCRTQKRCHPERSEGPAFLRALCGRSLRPLRFKIFRLDTHNYPAASAGCPTLTALTCGDVFSRFSSRPLHPARPFQTLLPASPISNPAEPKNVVILSEAKDLLSLLPPDRSPRPPRPFSAPSAF
jgi:hypothetical protein